MPLIDISIAEGRSAEQLRALMAGVHQVAESTVDAAPENITVIVREVPREQWSRNNQTIRERESAADDAAIPNTPADAHDALN